MVEVTDEMIALLREYQMGAYGEVDDDCDKRMIVALIELYEQSKPKYEPVKPDLYSNDEGEYWVQHPADCDIFSDWDDEPKVGDEYELHVCWTGKQKFRIAEIEDGSVEKVELIDSDTTYYTTPPARKPLSKLEIEKCQDIAANSYRSHKLSAQEQKVIMPSESYEEHLARAIEQAHGIGVKA